MKALVTGASGAVGTALCKHLAAQGHGVVPWDRARVVIDDPAAMRRFVEREAPDALFHLAIASQATGRPDEGRLINCEWPAELAGITGALGIPLVFTSTVLVFSDDVSGPFSRDSTPTATSGYGYEKRMAEEMVRERGETARIVRLGWQIGDAPGSNNMIDYFAEQTEEFGEVAASTRWKPSTSFLADTARALVAAVERDPGLYALESNERWSFHDIACALNRQHGEQWKIVASDEYVYDQRQLDGGIDMPSLAERLPELR